MVTGERSKLLQVQHTNLFEYLRRHLVTAVKDDTEFPTSLHFFEKGSRVLVVKRKLTDL